MYEHEKSKSLKEARKLTRKVVYPDAIQRMSASLSLAVFHESTAAALEWYIDFILRCRGLSRISRLTLLLVYRYCNNKGELWRSTASFVKWISDLIKIINVKSPSLAKRKLEPLSEPIRADGQQLERLRVYAQWFRKWQAFGQTGLTTVTCAAVAHTIQTLIDVSE